MKLTVTYFDHLLDITLTAAATRQLEQLRGPLYVDTQLYFGCIPKKKMVFDEAFEPEAEHMINSKLYVRYRSLITRGCGVEGSGEIYHPTPKQAGVLRWLQIDYRNGHWVGDFGLGRKETASDEPLEWAQHPYPNG